MIDPTTSPQYFGGSTSTSTTTATKKSLDKDAFMKLLVAQLSHQDPLSPLQPDQMAAQLAQFTSVEQLTKLNDAMATQTQASQLAALSAQSSMSTALIGREVEALGNQVMVPSAGQAQVKVDIGGTGGKGTLTLVDNNGRTIATRELGTLKPGSGQTLKLPGDLPPGAWHYKLDVKGAGGTAAAVTTYSTGLVNAVEFKNGEIVLMAGGLEISMSDLVRIAPAGTTTSGTTGTPTVAPPSRGEDDPLGLPVLPDGFTYNGNHYSN